MDGLIGLWEKNSEKESCNHSWLVFSWLAFGSMDGWLGLGVSGTNAMYGCYSFLKWSYDTILLKWIYS